MDTKVKLKMNVLEAFVEEKEWSAEAAIRTDVLE